jgi:Zn finger protein HypA/HybF involved in hydrogenase expression
MFCHNCGKKIRDDSRLCDKCNTEITSIGNAFNQKLKNVDEKIDIPSRNENGSTANSAGGKLGAEIKCGNCAYIGPGEPARRFFSMILAWLCVLFFWPITLIYFISTHKWRCPECKSTFLGVKNSQGIFVSQGRGSGASFLMILFTILIVIAIIGILSSIAIVYLNDARQKAADATVVSGMAN